MKHSYEEIRAATLDLLAGREKGPYPPAEPNSYEQLNLGVSQIFARREPQSGSTPRRMVQLSSEDGDVFREVFWDLFRQGIITLGSNDSNPNFPQCSLSRLGKRLVQNQQTYFFHDVSSYTARIQHEVPNIDPVTLLYLQEALQAFWSGCLLSASVMIGVATEHTFELVLEASQKSSTWQPLFAPAVKERMVLRKFNKFTDVLNRHESKLSPEIKEDLATRCSGILSLIREFRNDAGHPTGHILDREQAYVNLQLFIPYCSKMYDLMQFLSK